MDTCNLHNIVHQLCEKVKVLVTQSWIEPRSPTLQADALTSEPPGNYILIFKKSASLFNTCFPKALYNISSLLCSENCLTRMAALTPVSSTSSFDFSYQVPVIELSAYNPPMFKCCCCSVTQSRVATPWTAASQASLSFTISWSLLKLMSIELVMPFNRLILCRPLLLCPAMFPRIRVFSNESVLPIR